MKITQSQYVKLNSEYKIYHIPNSRDPVSIANHCAPSSLSKHQYENVLYKIRRAFSYHSVSFSKC